MSWLMKLASDKARLARNIERLEELHDLVHDLAHFAIASQSGGFTVLENLLENQLVKGRPNVLSKLKEALIGENNQKVALDAPTRFQRILFEAETLIQHEIGKENKAYKKAVKMEEQAEKDKQKDDDE
jgi:hypothetical protein